MIKQSLGGNYINSLKPSSSRRRGSYETRSILHIYILGNERLTLYIGVTNNLVRRIYEHKHGLVDGFSKKYYLKKLLYFEVFNDITSALIREKHLKHWNREWKLNFIKRFNPSFKDLYTDII